MDVEFSIEWFRLNLTSKDLIKLQEEFLAYQFLNEREIPQFVMMPNCDVEKEDKKQGS